MGVESKGMAETDDEVDSGWDDEPILSQAIAPAPLPSISPPNALSAPPSTRPSLPPSARPSVPPSTRPSVPPRPSRPSGSFGLARVSNVENRAPSVALSASVGPPLVAVEPATPEVAPAPVAVAESPASAPPDLGVPETRATPVPVEPRPLLEAIAPSLAGLETVGQIPEPEFARVVRSKHRAVMIGGVLAAAAVISLVLATWKEPVPAASPVQDVQAAQAPLAVSKAEAPSAPSTLPALESPSAVAPAAADAGLGRAVADAIAGTPKAVAGATRVTVRTEPPGAVIYDERRRIGKDIARIRVLRGQKRKLIALLDRHRPAHIVVDGTVETVNVELKPMDADELARATAYARAR